MAQLMQAGMQTGVQGMQNGMQAVNNMVGQVFAPPPPPKWENMDCDCSGDCIIAHFCPCLAFKENLKKFDLEEKGNVPFLMISSVNVFWYAWGLIAWIPVIGPLINLFFMTFQDCIVCMSLLNIHELYEQQVGIQKSESGGIPSKDCFCAYCHCHSCFLVTQKKTLEKAQVWKEVCAKGIVGQGIQAVQNTVQQAAMPVQQ